MRALGIIPARGGSKRLPRKNVLPLNGRPLIAYMIGAARASTLDRVVVSTEDEEIAAVAMREGGDVPFRRPAALAEDYAQDSDILLHAHDAIAAQEGRGYEIIVQLQPTSPFVEPNTISACADTLRETDANCCFAVRKVDEPPQWMFQRISDGTVHPLLDKRISGDAIHTQLLERPFFPSGAAYAVRTEVLRRERTLFVDPLRVVEMEPLRAVDVDEEVDLMLAELVAKRWGFTVFGSAN
ncbi:MAG TPA: acylneuraminate cytidylyltransferase family protein [Stellaceae bacterium]|nr:acylneuraminate cytidylyltransferase family protein [Stellaceae bacterium]